MKTLVEEFVGDPANMRGFEQERAILEVTELLEELMRKLNVSRAELAKRLGKTNGWVTQLLDTDANKTVRTVADAFAALGYEYHSSYQPFRFATKMANAASQRNGNHKVAKRRRARKLVKKSR